MQLPAQRPQPMSAVLALPTPLSSEQSALLAQFAAGTDNAGLLWASGYLAGIARTPAQVAPIHTPAAATRPATVLFGSQTGNARRAAEALHAKLEAAGMPVRLLRADAYATRELANERLLYVVISTQGEGDPPDDAIGFVEFLSGRRAPKLPGLKFAVLGLGDTSYADFCGIAIRIDMRLAELGAQRVAEVGLADLDIDNVAAPWRETALLQAREVLKDIAPTAPVTTHLATVTTLRPATGWSHERPFHAEVLANQRISGREFKGTGFRRYAAGKDVRHIELSLEGSGLTYEPGDALGIRHRNPESLVASLLQATQLDGDAVASIAGETLPLSEWLASRRELTRLSRPFLSAHAQRADAAELLQMLDAGQTGGLASLLADHQLIDVLRRWPTEWDADGLLEFLRPQAQRLYSIASSRKRVGDEAHLTVDILDYHAHGHAHLGAASGFLAALDDGEKLPVYIEPNERFRVPADASRDIIMIGPGTGVAPFRGFVQERAETGAPGRNWLFFGARKFNTDFLYQMEWQDALQRKDLHRLDLAFSRDQADKVYVQDRLRQRGLELYGWLQQGAHIYVCGSIAMGKDVHVALRDVIAAHNGGDLDAAGDYLSRLQADGRYSRDVY